MCALTGAVAELIMEILFSPIGYRVTKKWSALSVGKEYFDFIKKDKNWKKHSVGKEYLDYITEGCE